jgi:hypothetical protein
MNQEELMDRVNYHDANHEMIAKMENIRIMTKSLLLDIDMELEDCREKSLAITKIEEALMWVNKGITMGGK